MASGIQVNTVQEKGKLSLRKPFRYAVCILLCVLALFPFYILIVNSTLTSDLIKQGIHFIPGANFVKNYTGLVAKTEAVGVSLWKSMLNSLLITVPTVVLQVYFASLTAYAVTVYQFKGRNFVWAFIYAIMMIPTQVSIVGFIKVCNLTHLYGSRLALIIPAMAALTTVYFMKQYMEASFSVEIVEAARIDGASEFYTFNRIAVPLIMPAIATQAIFAFVASWNNLYTPSLILATEREKATMPMYVQALHFFFNDTATTEIYTGLFISILPIMVAYFLLSKYIVAGVALGGVKE